MDYYGLKNAIASWMHRGDITESSSLVDDFIDLFEARVNRNLRVQEMEKRTTITPTGEYFDFPSDFLELRSIKVNTSPPTILEYASPQKMDALGLTGGTPKYYTIIGNQIRVSPSGAGSNIEISYYGKITPLSGTNTSNFLLDASPDYYLMGCILEAAIYAVDDRATGIAQLVADKEAAIIRQGKNKQYGSGPLVVSAI